MKPKFFFKREAFVESQVDEPFQFYGDNSYIKSGPYRSSKVTKFSFEFKTWESKGVLLLAVQDALPEPLFAMVDIVNSRLRYSYNMGYGNVSIVSEAKVSDGKKHSVKMFEYPSAEYFQFKLDDKFLAEKKLIYPYDVLGDGYAKAVEAEFVYLGGAEKYPQIPQIM